MCTTIVLFELLTFQSPPVFDIKDINRVIVGLDIPTIEVRYEHLNIEAEAFAGGRALPSFINSVTNVIEGFLNLLHILPSKKKHVTILKDVSGIVKPRRMTLLLGPPSSGKTTLLLALSGKLDESLQASGRVTYNGHEMNEFVPQRTAAYISQHDVHIGEMTVRETLAFSARCQGVGSRYDMLSELSRREKAANIKPDPDLDVYMKATATEGQESSIVTDYTLKLLGLDICSDTMVGDEMLFKQYLLLLFVSQMASALFRAIGALGRNMIVANTFGAFAVLTLLALGGFILSRKDIKGWWIWGYWISPLTYGTNALMANEFLGNSWHNGTNNLGAEFLESRGFFSDSYWYWLGFGAVAGFVFLFNMLFGFALEFLGPFDKPQATITEEEPEANTPSEGTVAEVELPRIESSGRADSVVESSHERKKEWFFLLNHILSPLMKSYTLLTCRRRNKQLIQELGQPAPGSKDLHFPTQYSQSFLVQCQACLWKQRWSYWRNPPYTAVRFFFTTFIALMFGTMFWDLGGKHSNRQNLLNAIGSMYTAVLFLGVQNSSTVQPVVAVERTVFYREKAAGMYSALPYAFAQILVELPYVFAQAVTYGLIVYAMIGFDWTAEKFFWYLFFMYFTFLYFTFYGMMSVAVTPNHHVASIVAAAFYAIWNLFSGFIVARPSIPVWWRWYYWACPVAWTIYGLVASQFGDITEPMVSEGGKIVKDFIEDSYGIKHDFIGVCAVVVAGFAVVFAFIFAVAIKTFNFQKR
ncbi:ABC transporter G family member 40 [Spatholobus suberectus]|nr:ABC transporter G family member 40 [Spatholobus suberectus]